MPNRTSSALIWLRTRSRKTIIFTTVAAVLLAAVAYSFLRSNTKDYQFVTVKRDSITETVTVTGNTTPLSSVSLGFGNSGNIARINSSVGKNVRKGQVLAELNTGDLYSQLSQARANVSTQEANLSAQRAKLQGLQAGSRTEDVAASQAAFDKAVQDLGNMYGSVGDISLDSYAKAQDAIRVQLNQFFSNSETATPQLTYDTANSFAKYSAESERAKVTEAMKVWQTQIASNDHTQATINKMIVDGVSNLNLVRQLLSSISATLDNAPTLSATTVASYKANVTAALNQVNLASKNLTTASQNIASQRLTITQLQAQLELKKSGSAPQDIAVQQAQVESAEAAVRGAEASVQGALAKLQNSQIIAPIDGVITQFDAKVGQFASPGTVLVSIISPTSFEINALVSEIDVGKISLGNKVIMTIDAFPGETFTGSVFYIDPAQTASGGVVGYKIKVSFDTADARMKSGLTVNLDIETRKKENVLTLPQSAVLQNDDGTFVQVLERDSVKDVPVVLGLQDKEGNVEIVSGVNEGQQVINVGLR